MKFSLSNSRKSPDHQLLFIRIATLALKDSGKDLWVLVGCSLHTLGDFNRSVASRSKHDYSPLPLFEAAFSFGLSSTSTRKMLVNFSKSSRELPRWSGGCSTCLVSRTWRYSASLESKIVQGRCGAFSSSFLIPKRCFLRRQTQFLY